MPTDPAAPLAFAPEDEFAPSSSEASTATKATSASARKPRSGAVSEPIPRAGETSVRTAIERKQPPELTFRGQPLPPKRSAAFVLGYRQFAIADRLGRDQTWHLASVEVTPLRRYARLNLITEIGFEGGEAARSDDRADVMLVQKFGLGAQYPHWVTPLIEFQGGVGLARVELFERNDLVFVYTLGLDGGAQWAVTRWLFLHASIGWLRPTFQWPDRSLYYDRMTFKVGVGF